MGYPKRARVNPDYVMDIRIGPDGERTQQPHYLTERLHFSRWRLSAARERALGVAQATNDGDKQRMDG